MVAASSRSLSPSLAGRAGHAFAPHAMLQGFVCHARGVELISSTAKHVRARVRSKRMHDVDLQAEDGRLTVGCTCAARSLGLDVCKHAWAALLEVDRRGGLDELRAARGTLLVERASRANDKTPEPTEEAAGTGPSKTKKAAASKRAKAAKPSPESDPAGRAAPTKSARVARSAARRR